MLIGFFIGWPLYLSVRKASDISASRALIQNISTSIATYQLKTWTWEIPSTNGANPKLQSAYLWDLNLDGYIDGLPAEKSSLLTDGGFTPEQIGSGYKGFVSMVGPTIPKKFILKNLQVIDAWKQPLRIIYDKKKYAPDIFCVWSAGPDGIDGTPDDLVSANPKIIPPATPAAVP